MATAFNKTLKKPLKLYYAYGTVKMLSSFPLVSTVISGQGLNLLWGYNICTQTNG